MTIVKLNPVELTTLSETKLMQHCNSNVLLGEWRFIEMQEYAGETMYLWFEVSKERIRSDHYLPPQPSSLRLSLQSVPLLKGSCKGDSMIYLTNENSNIEKISFHYWHGHKVRRLLFVLIKTTVIFITSAKVIYPYTAFWSSQLKYA